MNASTYLPSLSLYLVNVEFILLTVYQILHALTGTAIQMIDYQDNAIGCMFVLTIDVKVIEYFIKTHLFALGYINSILL